MIGLTALSGKVVEHDGGYRAQHADVIAAAVIRRDGLVIFDDTNGVSDLFRNPIGTNTRRLPIPDPNPYDQVIQVFDQAQQKEEHRWT